MNSLKTDVLVLHNFKLKKWYIDSPWRDTTGSLEHGNVLCNGRKIFQIKENAETVCFWLIHGILSPGCWENNLFLPQVVLRFGEPWWGEKTIWWGSLFISHGRIWALAVYAHLKENLPVIFIKHSCHIMPSHNIPQKHYFLDHSFVKNALDMFMTLKLQ